MEMKKVHREIIAVLHKIKKYRGKILTVFSFVLYFI